MKRSLLTLFCFAFSTLVTSQVLTLEQCQELAQENYPALARKDLINKSSGYTISNAKRNWLPQVLLNVQATYQSDVMSFPDNFNNLLSMIGTNFEGLPKDQYKAAIQIEQVIWEGGAVNAQVKAAEAEAEATRQNWEIEMYSVKERVNQLFFGTLLLQEKNKEIDIHIEELNRNQNLVESYIKNGIANQSDLDQVVVEILAAKQRKSEITSTKKAYQLMLGIIINECISDDTQLLKPELLDVQEEPQINRPELKYFEAQERMLDAQKKGVNASVMPRIGAFLQGAYASPGLNLFEDMQKNQWSPYFIAGVNLQWNIGSFYTQKNKLSQIEVSRSQIASQKETFIYNINLKSTQENIAIEKMREVMLQDDEIINLRRSIRKRTESQIENGTKNINDLLRDINAENMARQNKVTHEIELLKNIYDLKYTINS
ncbi:MAG: TolC family protein [Prevotellaceae bacterium]|jgi:outer membrane protein TolC|nr:TolC family protein [Prevotellaceae bacterium]